MDSPCKSLMNKDKKMKLVRTTFEDIIKVNFLLRIRTVHFPKWNCKEIHSSKYLNVKDPLSEALL